MAYKIFNEINCLDAVFNFKYHYIRINGGSFNSQTLYRNFWSNHAISKDEHKQRFYKYLSRFLHYQKEYKIPIKFDCAEEADSLYHNLNEMGAIEILDWILDWQEEHKLDKDSIIFLTNDADAKLNTPEKYKKLVDSHFKYRFFSAPTMDINRLEDRDILKTFYFPIARQSEDRTNLHMFLRKHTNVLDNSYWSFNSQGLWGGFTEERFSEDKMYPLERYYEEYPKLLDWDHQFVGMRLMKQSFCSIILETFYQNSQEPERFFTEKTFRAFSNCHPFILCCNAFSLERLKKWGFKTFDRWWNESYDREKDDMKRNDMIIDVIKEINSKNLEELKFMYREMVPILKHNYELVKHLDKDFKEFQSNTNFTIMEGYEFPLEKYDIQENNWEGQNWRIIE